MKPEIVNKGQMMLAGFSFYGNPFAESSGWTEENEIGKLWRRFGAFLEHHGERIPHVVNPAVCYEAHISHEDTAFKGEYEVFVGFEIERLDGIPIELAVKVLPPVAYAVVNLAGEAMVSDWFFELETEQLPVMGYRRAGLYMLQVYDQRFKGMQNIAQSEIDAWVPVRRIDE